MARTRTLTNLLADVRYQADVEGMTTRHTDANITRLLNQSIQAFRMLVSRAGHPYYLTESPSANTVAGTAEYSLPTDFVQLYGVDLTYNGEVHALEEFTLTERNDYEDEIEGNEGIPVRYRIHSTGKIRFLPEPDGAYPYKLLYLPVGTDLSGASDTFDGIAGWEDWVVFDVALKILTRDDDDEQAPKIAALLAKKEAEIKLQAPSRSRTPTRRIDTRGRRRYVEAKARSPYGRP